MRRYFYMMLFAVVLVAPFVVRRVVATSSTAAGDNAAAASDAPELVVVTPHNQDIRRAFARAFADWHRERFGTAVRVTYLTPGGTNDIVRQIADRYEAQRDGDGGLPPADRVEATIDVVWGGGDSTFERELKPYLRPVNVRADLFEAAFPKPDLNGVALFERTTDGAAPKWVGVALSSFGIVYNPALYDTLRLPPPQAWADMARPELAGLVALADPTRSGSAAVTYMMAIQRAMADAEQAYFAGRPDVAELPPAGRAKDPGYQAALGAGWKQGMRTLLLIAANGRYFTDSASQVPNDVGNADAATGVAIDFYARVYEEQIGPRRIRYVAPRGATAITPDPVAVLYGVRGRRGELADRFVEFLLTPDAQRLWNVGPSHSPYVDRSLRRLPILRDVYADRAGWADADENPFEASGGFNMRGDWMRTFSEVRPIWAAAWIDARSTLKDAYAIVLRVPDQARRDRLIFELSDLPIELTDVEQQGRTRREVDAQKQDVRLWATKQRVAWADRFRTHYRAVAERAR